MENTRSKDYWTGFRDGFVESMDHPFISRRVISDDNTFKKALDREMKIYNDDTGYLFGIQPKIKNREDYAGGLRTGVYAGHVAGIATVGALNLIAKWCRAVVRKDLVMQGKYPSAGWEALAEDL